MLSKLFLLVVGVALSAALNPHHLSSLRGNKGGGSSDDAHAVVHSLTSDVRHDGFDYALQTSNNIAEQRSGDEYGRIHGDFSWVSHDGVPVHITYVADENGYQPSSDLLPTPPPIPKEIVKALEYLRTHPPYEAEQHHGGSHFASHKSRKSG